MAIKLVKVNNSFNTPQKQYICDSVDEMEQLSATFGDICVVAEEGNKYILNSSGEWYPMPANSTLN